MAKGVSTSVMVVVVVGRETGSVMVVGGGGEGLKGHLPRYGQEGDLKGHLPRCWEADWHGPQTTLLTWEAQDPSTSGVSGCAPCKTALCTLQGGFWLRW